MNHRRAACNLIAASLPVLLSGCLASKDLGLQLAGNPPMQTIARTPPPPSAAGAEFEVREGFTLIQTLDEFRAATKGSGQKIRLQPGVYRASTTDAPIDGLEHIFAVTGSDNHFDLRGVVLETPVSVQSALSRKAHVSDCWHVFGHNNVFEGGYFRNVLDRDYPEYSVAESEFGVHGNGNTFRDCTFVIRGSIPYGYTDYYGKGGPNFGRLNKHSFMGIYDARNTTLAGCQVYQQSFGHCIHLHGAKGVRIEKCLLSGTLRPTNDIFRETVGRASEYDFQVMYRGKRPIPHDEIIPLTEDGVRSYGGDRDVTVVGTTVERFRGCFQLLCDGDVTLENVTVREAGDFAFDLSSGRKGKVAMRGCRADAAYNPLFNLTRGETPQGAYYEVTLLDPPASAKPTPRASLGVIGGDGCTFVLRDGTTRPLPPEVARLVCGGKKGLTNSTVRNLTPAKLILDKRVRHCAIESVGPVDDQGTGNEVVRIRPER